MKKFSAVNFLIILSTTFLMSSCQAVGDLMKGSFYAGAIFVVVIIALIIYVIARMGKKS